MASPVTPHGPAPKLVALDLGGVLVDVRREALASLGPPDAVELAFFVGSGHHHLTDGRLSVDTFLSRAAATLGLPLGRVEDGWADMVELADGAVQLLRQLQGRLQENGAQLAFWSNTDPVHWEALAPALLPFTDDARCALSFRLGHQKPDAAFFAAATALAGTRAGAMPGEILFVDDKPGNVDAARQAGLPAHHAVGVGGLRAVLVQAGLLS